jgi:hypothetical protein
MRLACARVDPGAHFQITRRLEAVSSRTPSQPSVRALSLHNDGRWKGIRDVSILPAEGAAMDRVTERRSVDAEMRPRQSTTCRFCNWRRNVRRRRCAWRRPAAGPAGSPIKLMHLAGERAARRPLGTMAGSRVRRGSRDPSKLYEHTSVIITTNWSSAASPGQFPTSASGQFSASANIEASSARHKSRAAIAQA